MNKFALTVAVLLLCLTISAKEYHVSKSGNDSNSGTEEAPFLTIQTAANASQPGDVITVHKGTYRERVNPVIGGKSEIERIVYQAAEGEKVEIKGSEIVTGWKKEQNGIWIVTIPNSFFGNYNPFKDNVDGDWFDGKGRQHHTGDVYLNGKSLYEVETKEEVINPVVFPNTNDSIGSTYTWYCESDSENTTIWANFHSFNPNKELIEVSARRTCFYPDKPNLNYITLRGFHISQAATQWAAPTAEQVGMISTNWNKGWIIENNVISDTKCNGITLGKDIRTGHNVWSKDAGNINRDGNIHYIEVIFRTLKYNWDKEHIGSHIVRNNTIFNCEQTAICGSFGAIYSTIENNHIYNIWSKRQFDGWEIAGIKFHAPVDVAIKNNCIHDGKRAVWLDWMTQGCRVSGNLFFNNESEDLWVEVNHGPYIVDNNIMLSKNAIKNESQGGAFVHNLIAGKIGRRQGSRFTPYFLPHSTEIAGLTTIHGGDDRLYNNVFVGSIDKNSDIGTTSYEESFLPNWIDGNFYCNLAKPSSKEINFINDSLFNPELIIETNGNEYYLKIKINDKLSSHKVKTITTELLGKAKIPKALFDDPNSNPIVFDTDYFGNKRSEKVMLAGPFADLNHKEIQIKVWPK
jgi:hypothetical protein